VTDKSNVKLCPRALIAGSIVPFKAAENACSLCPCFYEAGDGVA
jgi:hypothetical protein